MSDLFAVVGGRLVDGTGATPIDDSVVLVRDGRVDLAGRAEDVAVPPEAAILDAAGMTVLPGLIDCHVHLSVPRYPADANLMLSVLMAPPPFLALCGLKNANLCLEAGFTTLRDMGGFFNWDNIEMISLRRAIDMGLVEGPRVLAGGVVAQTASHLELSGLGRLTPWVNTEQGAADGPWDVRRRVRKLIGQEADFIKVFASGWGGVVERSWWPNYTGEELAAICDEAHRYGKRVAAHVSSPETILAAARAGCDTLEHLIDIDDEGLGVMAEREIFAVPTLSLFSERGLARRAEFDSADSVDQIRRTGEVAAKTFQRLLSAGIRIANGSDTFRVVIHGDNADEIALMVGHGMSEMDAIVASTRNAAEALGLADDLGTLTPGKWADLLLVDGDPLKDIGVLQDKDRIGVVMKGGRTKVARGKFA